MISEMAGPDTVAEVARRNGVAPAMLYRWRKTYQETPKEVLPAKKESSFISLDQVPAPVSDNSTKSITVHYDGKLIVDFPPDTDPRYLAMVLDALRG